MHDITTWLLSRSPFQSTGRTGRLDPGHSIRHRIARHTRPSLIHQRQRHAHQPRCALSRGREFAVDALREAAVDADGGLGGGVARGGGGEGGEGFVELLGGLSVGEVEVASGGGG